MKSNVWKNMKADFQKFPNNHVTFNEFVGVKRAAAGAVSPQECFQLFMTKDMLEQIVQETNRYHMQELTKKASTVKWVNTTVEEVQALLGVILAMGLIKLLEIDDYWRRGSVYGMSWFPSIFRQDHFKQLLCYLHLANNEQE